MAEEPPISKHLHDFLQKREPPKTFCPSEVARSLSDTELDTEGVSEWRDLMPRIRELAWEKRDQGVLEILQKGVVLDSSITQENIKGPIRLRRISDS